MPGGERGRWGGVPSRSGNSSSKTSLSHSRAQELQPRMNSKTQNDGVGMDGSRTPDRVRLRNEPVGRCLRCTLSQVWVSTESSRQQAASGACHAGAQPRGGGFKTLTTHRFPCIGSMHVNPFHPNIQFSKALLNHGIAKVSLSLTLFLHHFFFQESL